MKTVAGRTDSIVIVGAGLGGLAAALHLAGSGRQVTILEREPGPGGRCGVLVERGYHFDTGPSVLTMPSIIEQTLSAVGESMADWLTLHRLVPAYRARFADGSQLDVHADVEAMAAEIATVCGRRESEGYRRYVTWLRELYQVEMPNFIDCNLDSSLSLGLRPMLRLAWLGGFGRLARKVGSFMQDDRLRRIFSFQAMYAGLAPMNALASYAVITYMDCVQGVYFPEGGMHALPRALADAATKHGVQIRYGCTADRIEISNARAQSVITADGERIAADVVVVNGDLARSCNELLPPDHVPARLRRLQRSPSCVLIHAGSSTTLADPAHHIISFGRAWESTFAELIKAGRLMSDPSFLLSTPTVTDPALAPPGRHLYQVLVPVPSLDQRHPIDWVAQSPRYLDTIMKVLDARGFNGLANGDEPMVVRTPADWQAAGLSGGAPFGAAHTVRQTGPFRPATIHPRIENLLFCGSDAQPGIGVPMVLISGRLAAERVTGGGGSAERGF